MVKAYPVILAPAETGYVVTIPDHAINTRGKDIVAAVTIARDAISMWGVSS